MSESTAVNAFKFLDEHTLEIAATSVAFHQRLNKGRGPYTFIIGDEVVQDCWLTEKHLVGGDVRLYRFTVLDECPAFEHDRVH